MTTTDLLINAAETLAGDRTPEAESFLVLTDDETVARQVAPMLAARLRPTRRFGRVLHCERLGDGTTEVAVEVLRGRPFSAVRVGQTAHTAHGRAC